MNLRKPDAQAVNDWNGQADAALARAPSIVDWSLLDLAQHGLTLRRELDESADVADTVMWLQRAELSARLCRVQNLVVDYLAKLPAEHEDRQLAGPRIDRLLKSENEYLSELFGRHDLDQARRAFLLDSFRADLQWASNLIAALDGEPMLDPALPVKAHLHKVQQLLEPPVPDACAKQRELLLAQQGALQTRLLVRRAQKDCGQPIAETSPVELWRRRLQFSRLQSELLGRQPQTDEIRAWCAALTDRRRQLAETAQAKMATLALDARGEAWRQIVLAAAGEVNETNTYIEEIPLDAAVKIVELSHEDLDLLADSCGRFLRESAPAPKPARAAGRRASRLARSLRADWQERGLACRMHRLFGDHFVGWLEWLVFLMIVAVAGVIVAETVLHRFIEMTDRHREILAYTELVICSVLLLYFAIKLALAPPAPTRNAPEAGWWSAKWLYLRRHFLVDFLAAIPFGFVAHVYSLDESAAGEAATAWIKLLWILRLPGFAQYVRVAQPFLRIGRLAVFSFRAADHLVRRYASVFNRNVILFEPERQEAPERRYRHAFVALRSRYARRSIEVFKLLDPMQRMQAAERTLADLQTRLDYLPMADAERAQDFAERDVRIETLAQRLIETTPDGLVDQMGQPFVDSVARYLKLLNVPLVRRLPPVRELIAAAARSKSETAALAANYLGYSMHAVLRLAYYLADLQGTVTGPIFLDRLGTTMVQTTSRPTKRLLILGVSIVLINGLIQIAPTPPIVDVVAKKLRDVLGTPVIILGLVCAVPLALGIWLRRIANQASEFSERVVEAQFAAQTKAIKQRYREQDFEFLSHRLMRPELRLRAADDQPPSTVPSEPNPPPSNQDELLFLHNIEMLYEDYLDGSLFHRSDTKTTMQLLGNLALTNLRLSNLAHTLRDTKRMAALDLNRAGTLFGGPYLWFNYITRLITQQTARLMIDYNRNAVPLARLACSSQQVRERYRQWLARRLELAADQVELPAPIGAWGGRDVPPPANRRAQAQQFLESVDFTALDFLTDDPQRDAQISEKYGGNVARLVARDRCRNVRRAFRSFPLQQVPLPQRTFNFFVIYETYLSEGKILLAPFRLGWLALRAARFVLRRFMRLVTDVLHPQLQVERESFDSYAVAQRKIHRMRKPVFMESLWLRARFDLDYLGIPIPAVPFQGGGDSYLESDLDFIGASRQDRLQADRLRRDHRRRLEWIGRWLRELGLDYPSLPGLLRGDFPYLADRSAEVARATVTACLLDHDDLYTLLSSAEGLRRLMSHAADLGQPPAQLPAGLPDTVDQKQLHWYLPLKRRRRIDELFQHACFSEYDAGQRQRIAAYLRQHRRVADGWIETVLSQGGNDPLETARIRLRDVIARTDLWSDQILALRTIQTLTMLDVFHYSQMVWKLGGYEALEPTGASFLRLPGHQ